MCYEVCECPGGKRFSLPPTAGAGLQLHHNKVQGDRDGGGGPQAVFSLHFPGQTRGQKLPRGN